jgi:hypothetical protein
MASCQIYDASGEAILAVCAMIRRFGNLAERLEGRQDAETRSAVACHKACCACKSPAGATGVSGRALLTEK